MLFKVLIIPYVRRRDPLYLVVHDRMYKEWTFISGGKKMSEMASSCASREVLEETRNLVHIDPGQLEKSIQYQIVYKDKNVNTSYTVFFAELGISDQEIKAIENTFAFRCKQNPSEFCREMNENDDLKFMTIEQIHAEKHVWPFIEEVINSKHFLNILSTIDTVKEQEKQAKKRQVSLPVNDKTQGPLRSETPMLPTVFL